MAHHSATWYALRPRTCWRACYSPVPRGRWRRATPWIGWSHQAHRTNLSRVVNNDRFLILPWVEVPHLASHGLALAAHQLPTGWQTAYGVECLLLEALVDWPYTGTYYCAANWICVGQAQGRAGGVRQIPVKVVRIVYSRKARPDLPLLLVVIKPLGYRLRKGSKLLYPPAHVFDLHRSATGPCNSDASIR